MNERRLFTADECARTETDLQVECEIRSEHVRSEQPRSTHMRDRVFKAPYRHRVFRAHIEESPMGADGISTDGHPFENGEWIPLQHAPVHERPWVALVGIANDILDVPGRVPCIKPFFPSRVPPAPSSPQIRTGDLLYQRGGIFRVEHFRK